MTIQLIKQDDQPEWAVIPYETYLELVEKAELLQDLQDYDNIKASLARGEEELIPAEVVYALLDGDNPIRVWREHRGMSRQSLAEQAGISAAYLSQLENGKRKGGFSVLTALSNILNVSLEQLSPIESRHP